MKEIDLRKVKTYPIKDRASKVQASCLAKPYNIEMSLKDFLLSMPDILAAKSMREIVNAVNYACHNKKPVIFGMGGHVVKAGLSPIIIDLIKRGIITAIAANGSFAIHDFEMAWMGKTSEDVQLELEKGTFGMADETGRIINKAIKEGIKKGLGFGEAVGKKINDLNPTFISNSVMAAAYKLNIPATIHVAIGTDIVHMHPSADGGAIGESSFKDFKIFTSVVSKLGSGGVYFNIGSAVIMPEVFLKALSLSRNLGHNTKDFVTVNLDFIQHYRPVQNVVNRPTAGGGKGYAITGHHEIIIPLLAAWIIESLEDSRWVKSSK